jgi:hypothetical protein
MSEDCSVVSDGDVCDIQKVVTDLVNEMEKLDMMALILLNFFFVIDGETPLADPG